MSHGGIATRKFLRVPKVFCALINMPKLYAILVHKLLQKRINVNVAKTILRTFLTHLSRKRFMRSVRKVFAR